MALLAPTLALLAVLPQPALADVCKNDKVQDINCNNISVTEEGAVDLQDPVCAAVIDEFGSALTNRDYYLEYDTFGCMYPLIDYSDPKKPIDWDPDKDGLGGTGDPYPVGETGGLIYTLSCDNCPSVPNNDQL
ncbi:hypothetical protein L6R53_00520, partial [Myxococcota bacterium]|nr:hypothetical protein [Myxococcota bacterium]